MMKQIAVAALAALALAACNQASAPKGADVAATEKSAEAPAAAAPPGAVSEPAYVGAWATDLSYCALEQDDPDAPMLMSAQGYDQYEAHCEFEAVTPAGADEWNVAGRCTTALTEDRTFKFRVESDRLTISSDVGTNAYVRCPQP